MRKHFVLDTNVLLHDPYSLFKFKDNTLIVPITVIEELDRFKKDLNMIGRNARVALRIIDSTSNGLSYVVEKFKNEPIAGSIMLVKGERSELAELSSNIL